MFPSCLERLNVSKRLLKTWDSNSAHPNRAWSLVARDLVVKNGNETRAAVDVYPKLITCYCERAPWRSHSKRKPCTWVHFFHMISLKDNVWNFGFKQDGTTSRDCNRGYAENTRYHCSWGLNWCALASSPPFAMAFFRWYATNWYSTCMPNITSHLQAYCWQSSSLYQGNTFHCTWEISHWAAIDCRAQVGKPGPSESDWSTDHGAFTWCYSPINWSTLNATRTLLTSELCKPAAFPESDSEDVFEME